MSSWKDRISPDDPTNEQLRVSLFIGLGLLHISAEILAAPPAVETVLEAGDPERFRLLSAAEAARCWLVGHGAADSTDAPGVDSALAGAFRALDWTPEELARHFSAALADFREDM